MIRSEAINRNKTIDREGNVIKETDAKLKYTLYAFDARGRKISSTDRLAGITTWTFDANDNLLSLTDAQNQTTSYEFDTANRCVRETYPDHVSGSQVGSSGYGIVEFTYDGGGRPKMRVDQQGDLCTQNYDLAGRLTSRSFAGHASGPLAGQNSTDTFTFDQVGRVLSAVSGRYGNTVTFGYDAAGRLASESLTIGGQSYTLGNSYDQARRRTQVTYPDGSIITNEYSVRDHLLQVQRNASTTATFTYDNGGRELTRTFGNGVTSTKSWRPDNGIESINVSGISTFTYGYDQNKSTNSEAATGALAPFGWTTGASGYDHEARLVSWTRTDNQLANAWTLSAAGDWSALVTNGVSQSRSHGAAHELQSVGATPLTYDAKGNLTSGANGSAFTFDFDNHLATATAGSGSTTYQYDALGRRVAKTVAGQTSVFVQSLNPLQGYPNGVLAAEYVLGASPSQPLRTYTHGEFIDDVLSMHEQGTPYYYHQDSRYCVRCVTNSAGAPAEYYAYSAYGTPAILASNGSTLLASSAIGNRLLFMGQEFDFDTVLYFFRARYLHASLGRFLTRDLIGYVDGTNDYEFVHGRPTVLLDPTGHNAVWDWIVAIASFFANFIPIVNDIMAHVQELPGTNPDAYATCAAKVDCGGITHDERFKCERCITQKAGGFVLQSMVTMIAYGIIQTAIGIGLGMRIGGWWGVFIGGFISLAGWYADLTVISRSMEETLAAGKLAMRKYCGTPPPT